MNLQPHSDNTERVILAACIYTKVRTGNGASSPYWQIAGDVEASDFYREHHRHLWRAIEGIADEAQEVWADGVISQLERDGKLRGELEDGTYVRNLADRAPPNGSAIQSLALELRELARRRDIQSACERTAAEIGQGEPSDDASKRLSEAMQGRSNSGGGKTAREVAEQYLARLEGGERQPRYSTGITPVDRALHGGLVEGRYYILAARPKMGKTKLAVSWATHLLVEHDFHVDFWFTDGVAIDLGREYIAALSNVNTKDLQAAESAPEGVARLKEVPHVESPNYGEGGDAFRRAAEGVEELGNFGDRLRFFDRSSPSPREILQTARARSAECDRYAVFVDYLQNCDAGHTGPSAGRLNTEAASKAMREIRSECGAVTVGLAQFNRSVRNQEGLPKPSQMKSSGALEQDANHVLVWHRPHFLDEDSPLHLNRLGVFWHCLSKHEEERMEQVDADLGAMRFAEWDGPAVQSEPGGGW